MTSANTAERLLDVAASLVQRRGFNAFSYRDLADVVGIKTASIHYHFPTKADLASALLTRYSEQLDEALAEIDRESRTARKRLARFVDLYRETAATGDRICLCGAMAADIGTLPDALRPQVHAYLDRSIAWLEQTISAGRRAGEIPSGGGARTLASMLVSALQGALIHARAIGSTEPVNAVERAMKPLFKS